MRFRYFSIRVVWLFYFLSFVISIKAQYYFNKRFDFYSQNNGSMSFTMVNDTFYAPLQLLDTHEGVVGKITNDGISISTNKYSTAFINSYYYPNAILNYNNKLYCTGGGGYYNNISSLFYKYKLNGDTIHTSYYGDTSYYSLPQKIVPYSKSTDKLLLVGTTDSTCGLGHSGLYKPIIRVVDTNGVLINSKIYLSTCEYRSITASELAEDKGFLIGFSTTSGTWGFESRLMKLDSNLNFIWNYKITESGSGYMGIVNSNNQNFYVATTIVDSVWNFTYKWDRPSLTKLDLNGNIIWQKYYGLKQQDIGVTGLKKCNNGDFIMSGSRRTSYNELKGFIIRTDSLGNLKWWKDYRPDATPLDTTADNYLWDIIELPNKDIAAVGWSSGTSLNLLQQTWLLKVDSNGCFGNSNCPQNLITGIVENNSLNVGLTVYPNPFKDELNINYSILDFDGKAQLQLIELSSEKVIDNIELTQSFGTKQFNTQHLANGLYVLSLKQEHKPTVNFKAINIR